MKNKDGENRMDKAWVDRKNREYTDKIAADKAYVLQQLKENEYMDEARKKECIDKFEKGNYIALKTAIDSFVISCVDKMACEAENELDGIDEWSIDLRRRIWEISQHYIWNYQNKYDRYLDSEPVEFDGDIIITDPCYIEKDNPEVGERPRWEDYFTYSSPTEYPDYRKATPEEIDNLDDIEKIILELGADDSVIYKSEQFEREKQLYSEAEDEYEKNNLSDWEKSDCGKNMEALGFSSHYITRDTLEGDWSCTTYNSDTEEVIGHFCADAGMVSVFLLDDVLRYNPNFDYHITKPWTTTWIKDFKGTVQIIVKEESYEDYAIEVIGYGINKKTGEAINFEGKQTGF